MELKEKLVALRKEKGLTQLAVAEKLDVSRQAISRWESGMALPSTDNLKCLGALYGVPVDYLINEGTERFNSESNNKKETEDQRDHSNWCYYISGNGWYMVKIEEDNVSFLRFSPISKYFPSHVVKISDIATYNLTQERYEKKVGWDDATFIISPDQEVGISVRLHEVKNGSLQDSILLLKISKSCSDICDGCDFAQIVTTGQGSNVLVSVLRQPIEQ